MNATLKVYLRFLLKLLATCMALFFVFKKIDIEEFLQTISSANSFYYIIAIAAYNVSQITSVYRLNHFYKAAGLNLGRRYNLKLYYVGMFYNLFLPGAIGGDGYKVYILKKNNQGLKTRHLISATFLDRVSGLVALFTLGCIFLLFSSFDSKWHYYRMFLVFLISITFPAYYVVMKSVFPLFIKKYFVTNFYSLAVQCIQAACGVLILLALQINGHFFDYLTLFMISSVVAVLPFTVGGVGARELVFIYGFNYLNINRPAAIAFTILFFMVTAITSFTGLLFSCGIEKPERATTGKQRSLSE